MLKIPGLIADKKEDSKLTQSELQAKRDSFEAYVKMWKEDKESSLSYDQQYKTKLDNLQQQALLNTPNPGWEYSGGANTFNNQPSIIGQFGQLGQHPPGTPGIIGNSTESMSEYLGGLMYPKKTPLEELVNSIFDTAEKEQFLMTLGFEFYHEDGHDWIKREVAGFMEKGKKSDIFEKVFLREITIKFKNLLISKASLKMKL